MEVKPSFFSVVGFLAPGVVLLGGGATLFYFRYPEYLSALLGALTEQKAGAAVVALLGTLSLALLLTSAFATGAVLSDTFTSVGRSMLRRLSRPHLRDQVDRLLAHKTLAALVRADMSAREALVYIRTCGLDLHWYAGRVRLMGGTGLASIILAIVAACLCFRCPVILSLAAFGFISILVALIRSSKFDEYVAATSAVLLLTPNDSRSNGDDAGQ